MPLRLSRRALGVLFAAVALLVPAARPSAAAASGVQIGPEYQPPVDAPVIDGFRPPTTPYGPGNRGLDYATPPGTPVWAAAPGLVVFAGQVGGTLHVVVLHGDGIRTTYSFLASITVRRDDRVAQGDQVGTSGPTLHFGARNGDSYIAPLSLFSAAPRPRARLLPDDGRGLPPEAAERGAVERLLHSLRAGGAVSVRALAWAAEHPATAPTAAIESGVRLADRVNDPALTALVSALAVAPETPVDPHLVATAWVAAWEQARGGCTPREAPLPKPRPGPRLAVLVAGLGSSAGSGSILHLPIAALGYPKSRVFQFSYRGGTVDHNGYGSADTQVDLVRPAARLRAVLLGLAAGHPSVPIDVFAHSQGGLVALLALSPRLPAVAHLITLATPFGGADLAGIVDRWRTVGAVLPATAALAESRPLGLDPAKGAPGALKPTSRTAAGVARTPLPAGVRITSIGSSADYVVPVGRTWLAGAVNAMVDVRGVNAHTDLPGSRAALREVALALADRPPTCQSLVDALVDAARLEVIAEPERVLGQPAAIK